MHTYLFIIFSRYTSNSFDWFSTVIIVKKFSGYEPGRRTFSFDKMLFQKWILQFVITDWLLILRKWLYQMRTYNKRCNDDIDTHWERIDWHRHDISWWSDNIETLDSLLDVSYQISGETQKDCTSTTTIEQSHLGIHKHLEIHYTTQTTLPSNQPSSPSTPIPI